MSTLGHSNLISIALAHCSFLNSEVPICHRSTLFEHTLFWKNCNTLRSKIFVLCPRENPHASSQKPLTLKGLCLPHFPSKVVKKAGRANISTLVIFDKLCQKIEALLSAAILLRFKVKGITFSCVEIWVI